MGVELCSAVAGSYPNIHSHRAVGVLSHHVEGEDIMSDKINLYFILLDTTRTPRRIEEGDWTLEMLLKEDSTWAKKFIKLTDKIAWRPFKRLLGE